MKTLLELSELSAEGRAKMLKGTVTTAKNAKTTIAKIIVAAEKAGDFEEGEMNSYCQRVTGIELRRELQGTYEAVNLLKGILTGKIEMSETQFEVCPDFGRVILSGFLSKSPEKIPAAVEIILSKTDVTKRLKELKDGEKKPKAEKPKAEATESEPSGIQTAPAPAANEHVYVIPRDIVAMNHPELLARIIAEVKDAGTVEDCKAFISMFDKLAAYAETRMEALEAEAAAPAAPVLEAVAA